MKVKIIKCTDSYWWYSDRISQIFDVEQIMSKSLQDILSYVYMYNKEIHYIHPDDCIVLNREEKLKRILK